MVPWGMLLMGAFGLLGFIAFCLKLIDEVQDKPSPTNRWWLRGWQKAGASGVQGVEKGTSLRTRAGPLEVRIDPLGDQDLQIAVVVPGPPDFEKVRICPKAEANPWVPDIEIGEAWFDRTFSVEGPLQLVFALLDGRTRHLLQLCLDPTGRLVISHGEIRAVIPAQKLSFILPRLQEAGQRLAQPLDVLQRVAENARRDPEAGVRLRAAKALGAEGRDILLEFAASKENDALSAGAVSILDRELPFEHLEAIFDNALGKLRIRTARACLEVLGHSGKAAAVDMLARALAAKYGELAVAAAQALGATGSPAAEPPLLLALQSGQADLRVAAAHALGHAGSAAAVLPLHEAAQRSSVDLALRRATHQAIAEIQSRLQGALPGQLSLAGTEAGQLSLAPEPGQLSLASADPSGQISLAQAESGQPPSREREGPGGRRV